MKKTIRLTESDLIRLVKRVIRENQMDMFPDNKYDSKLKSLKNKVRTTHNYDEFIDVNDEVSNLEQEIQNDSQLDQDQKDNYLNQWEELLDYSMRKGVSLQGQKSGDYDYYEGDMYASHGNERWINKQGLPGNYEFNDDEFEDEEYGEDQFDDFVDKYGMKSASRMYGTNPKQYYDRYTAKGQPLKIKRRK
jgi:hypothetical protein